MVPVSALAEPIQRTTAIAAIVFVIRAVPQLQVSQIRIDAINPAYYTVADGDG
jgi:hypothetical protein